MSLSEHVKYLDIGQRLWLKAHTNIQRYMAKENDQEKKLEMIHRTDNYIHLRRVAYGSEVLAKVATQVAGAFYKPDVKKVFKMGLGHDDPEIVTNDLLASVKAKMNEKQREELEKKEDLASFTVAHLILGLTYPEDQEYIDEQREIRKKQTLEAQIVDVADKWDSLCEIMHEVRCGNQSFAPLVDQKKETFVSFDSKYPFYQFVKHNPGLDFDNIPDPKQVLELPKINIDDLKTPKDVAKFMSLEKTQEWPAFYRTWALLNITIFDRNPEKFIFPGWYMELWKKWGHFPKGTTTTSGLLIP